MAKKLDSTYEPGSRSRSWLKIKNHLAQEFVVGGYLPGVGSRGRLGALLLGVYALGQDAPVGSCTLRRTGRHRLHRRRLTRLLRLLEPLAGPTARSPRSRRLKEAIWVEPELVAEVAFTEWTGAGILRHPSYKGLRDDKDPREVVREMGNSPCPEPSGVGRSASGWSTCP